MILLNTNDFWIMQHINSRTLTGFALRTSHSTSTFQKITINWMASQGEPITLIAGWTQSTITPNSFQGGLSLGSYLPPFNKSSEIKVDFLTVGWSTTKFLSSSCFLSIKPVRNSNAGGIISIPILGLNYSNSSNALPFTNGTTVQGKI